LTARTGGSQNTIHCRLPAAGGNEWAIDNSLEGLCVDENDASAAPKPAFRRAAAGPGTAARLRDDARRGVGRKTSVRVGRTRVGDGVFARKWYRGDEIVGEIEGSRITDEQYSSEYCMDLEDGSCLEPEAPFRFLNHSCDPNCRFNWHDLRQEGKAGLRRRVFLFALRTIRPDEELTIDYGWPASYAIPCRCGSASCRGWVVAEEELSAVVAAQSVE